MSLSFKSEDEHKAAVYDACVLIVETYMNSSLLDGLRFDDVALQDFTSFRFMKLARAIANKIADGSI